MQAVIFDLFETLVTEWDKPKYTSRAIASDLDVDFQAFDREKKALSTAHFLGKFPDTTQFFEEILRKLDLTRDTSLLLEIARKREEYKRKCFDIIEPGITEMLSALKEKGCKIGLISNCSPEEIGGFWDSSLCRYFDAVVMSCDVGLIKPDAKIYEHCLTMLNETPSNCLFIGDGSSDELNGARKAGLNPLKAVWFTKHFADINDDDASRIYPILFEPSEVQKYIIA